MNSKKKVIRAVTLVVLLSTLAVASESATVVARAIPMGTAGISKEISKAFSEALENVPENDVPDKEVSSTVSAGISREISKTFLEEDSNLEELVQKLIYADGPVDISGENLETMLTAASAIHANSGISREISEILRYVAEHSAELTVTPNPERQIVKCGNGRIFTKEEAEYIIAIVAMVIHGEASVCDSAEKYRVATVFMNRFERADYPDTVEEVLKDGYDYLNYQDEEPTEEEKQIAREVVLNSIRVYDEDVVYQAKHPQGKTVEVSDWHYYGSEPLPEE